MDDEMVECRVGVRFLMDVVGEDRAYLKGDEAMIPILTAWTWVATGVAEPLKRPPGLYYQAGDGRPQGIAPTGSFSPIRLIPKE